MKTTTFQGMKIRLDRPKGFVQEGKDATGKPWRRVYQNDYGYLPRTQGGDGDGLDVFLGPDKDADEAFWAIQKNDDGDFDEYKVMLGFPDKRSALAAYKAHIPAKYLDTMITMKVSMMRSLLGIAPAEKLAMALGFLEMREVMS